MTPAQLKNSILQYAIQGKLVRQRKEEVRVNVSNLKKKKIEDLKFDIPEIWEISHLELISETISTKKYQIKTTEYKKTGIYPVISQSKDFIVAYCDDNSKLFKNDDSVVVFGDHTTEVKYVDFDFIVGADGVKIFKPKNEYILGKFLKIIIEFYSNDLSKKSRYSRNYKFIKNKPIPLPPLEEQKRIVAKIEELLPLVDEYAKAYEELERLNAKFPEDIKKSILQYAIQGKLVRQQKEDGTAEELYKKIQEEKEKLIKEGKIKKTKTLTQNNGR